MNFVAKKVSESVFLPAVRFLHIVITLSLLCTIPPAAKPSYENISDSESRQLQIDHAELADTFFKSLGKDSPLLLEKYLKIRTVLTDTGALARVGGYLSAGDYSDAYGEIRKFVGDKMIDSIPVFGTMGKLGAGLGHWATDHFGKGRFDSLYAAAQKRLDAADWERGFESGFVQALMTEGTKGGNIYTWLNEKSGVKRSHSENEKLLWRILKAKHDFEKLCDKYHLQGEDRNYDILMIYINADIRSTARQAVRREKMRAEERAFIEQRKKENAEERAREMALEDKKRCSIWLRKSVDPDSPYSYEDRPSDEIIQKTCGEKPKPQKANDENGTGVDGGALPVGAASSDDNLSVSSQSVENNASAVVITFPPKEPEIDVSGGISVSISRKVIGDATYCTVTVTNTSQRQMGDLSLSVEATEPYNSGGIGGGGTVSIGPGEIRTFTVSSFGEAKGARGAFSLGDRSLGGFSCYSAHEVRETVSPASNIDPDGVYGGIIKGGIANGSMAVIIKGSAVSGGIRGRFESGEDTGSVKAAIKGRFDRKSGIIKGTFEGSAVNEKDGSKEGIGGSFDGKLRGSTFSGTWEGSASLASDEGEWRASLYKQTVKKEKK